MGNVDGPGGSNAAQTGDPNAVSSNNSQTATASGDAGNGDASTPETPSFPAGAACPSFAILCDDFEASGTLNLDLWTSDFQDGAVVIDESTAAEGSRSVHVSAGSANGFWGGQSFANKTPIAAPDQQVYLRVYMRFEDLSLPGWHPFFITAVGPDYNPDEWWLHASVSLAALRNDFAITVMGFDESAIWADGDAYSEPGDSTPDSEHQLQANTWFCFEMLFDGQNDATQVWIDGQEVSDFHTTDDTWYNDPDHWSPNYDGSTFSFGVSTDDAHAYDIWYDALAMAHERVGCIE
ncbi:MAG: hypothetical protein IPJ88_04395 [Myxococcales bacterium]|nr:MAG: hypothetical protein IPJ88_04395 [Myxococcales bacterium]